MSGGSFDYLCHADATELFSKRDELRRMVEALSSMGYKDAASETEEILLILRHFEARLGARVDRLSKVWKAVEWLYSGDWSAAQLDEEIAEYRADIEPKKS